MTPILTGSHTGQNRQQSSAAPSIVLRLIYGHPDRARWERPGLLALLAGTSVLYLYGLALSGWANPFYSAAAQAGSINWEAFFYGSSDPANSITVDKPPASLWIMALSVRILGLSPFSILLPEALMGVATVATVYFTVRRHFPAATALLAGGILALTPVAALMFRYNNPDALLVLLLTLAAYFTLRGIEGGKLRWVLLAGMMIGFGFLTKQLQAFLILPVLASVYLWATPVKLSKRLLHLLAALGAVLVTGGWWVAIVETIPAGGRPYIGGSQTNDFLELTFGYNGFGRLTGHEPGSVVIPAAHAESSWGATGALRLLDSEFSGQISWLLPAGILLMIAAFVLLRKAPRTDARRATLSLFAGSLLVTAAAFSFMGGIIHAYYTVVLAPPLAAVLAIGSAALWSRRSRRWARIVSASIVFLSAFWAYVLLLETSPWIPWLNVLVLMLAALTPVLIILPRAGKGLGTTTMAAILLTGLIGPAAYTLNTISTAHHGAIVAAGPPVHPVVQPVSAHSDMDLILNGTTVGPTLAALLSSDAHRYRWAAAVAGSNNAANYQLASGEPVMALGGFNGTDPTPTLAAFKSMIADGEVHYFIGNGPLQPLTDVDLEASKITSWVSQNYSPRMVDGTAVYDLSNDFTKPE